MEGNRVILLEFNELCPTLMHRFMSQGKLPNFQRLYGESQVCITEADGEPPHLEPWIQWVTVHSGVPYQEHGIQNLDEGHKLRHKCIWEIVSEAGQRAWVCGSMNARYGLPFNGCVLPDPWTTKLAPYPASLGTYFRFVQTHVAEHTRDNIPLALTDHAKFAAFMATHGLSSKTIGAIVKQLQSERRENTRWKRAAILDKLQFDLFQSVHRRLRPRFSTFFLNSTAHFQHLFWREMEPEHFQRKPTDEERAQHKDAIVFGYQSMDELAGRFLEMADADANTTLVYCTALSQQPCLKYEESGGKSLYRPLDFEKLLTFADITAPHTVSPVMSEQFHIRFETESDARQAEHRLGQLTVDGRRAMASQRNGNDILTGCTVFETLPRECALAISDTDRSIRFFEAFYKFEGLKSGMHHPDGMLWIRRPEKRHNVYEPKVPLMAIAPTLISMLSLPQPASMSGRALPYMQSPS